ncbi:putative bifunctional diguanylate cyclase/phosphodiesterase [Arsenicicoccus dermatophilus]|uniref:putative bifunctional diguanylate cyclase/phosphodiesterase n=1 Tax=Arsenicicoccus dermatophilus TaxID=1076331 RepID=UPI003916F6C9
MSGSTSDLAARDHVVAPVVLARSPEPQAPAPPRAAYLALTTVLAVGAAAALVVLPHGSPLETSRTYLAGLVLVAAVAPVLHSRVVRLAGSGVTDPPESLVTLPLLLVAPLPGYVLAMAWVCLCTCVRLRVRPIHTTFNLAGTAATSVLTAVTYHDLVAPGGGLTPRTVAATLLAVGIGALTMELLVWLAFRLDGVRTGAPSLATAPLRTLPVLVGVGLALCSVALASSTSTLGAVLGVALLGIVVSHLAVSARAAHQRWLTEQLYQASERLRALAHREEVPEALAKELATLWHAGTWSVTDRPPHDGESYRVVPGVYAAVTPGRGTVAGLTRPTATSLVDTAAEVMRSLDIEQELRLQATRDALTGLGSRHRLWEALDQRLPEADVASPLVLMSVDVDSFKAINDTYGHVIGDQLLVAVAARLDRWAGADDVVARMAGDEFLVLGASDGTTADLRRAHTLQQALSEPFTLGHNVLQITCSIGVHHVDRSVDRGDALSAADAALVRAKRSGRGTVALATEEVVGDARRLLRLNAELRAAMHQGEFTLHYQPMVDAVSGRPTAVEALLRWERDGVPLMGPAEFIPYAEESGLISAIGRWVLHRACQDVHVWNQTHRPADPLRVSVNISTVHIAQPDFVAEVAAILDETRLPAELLILEVTETFAMLDLAASVDTVAALRRLGVALWLDDFGTGYSSLEYLRQLPVEVVKLDRSFLTDIGSDSGARGFLEAIVHLCRSIGREPLAEGVELPEQRTILADLGCTAMQGYLFARPTTLDRLTPRLLEPGGADGRSA